MEFCYKLFFIFLSSVYFIQAAKILAFFPLGGASHFNIPEVIFKALAARGHNITLVSSYPQRPPIPNINDIDVSSARGTRKNSLPFEVVQTQLQSTRRNFNFIANVSRTYCDIVFDFPEIKNLLNRDKEFDLVMTEIFGADCAVGFAWKFKAPLVSILISRGTPWSLNRIGNPSNPSYLHVMHSDFPRKMNFIQRFINSYWYLYFSFFYYYSHNGEITDQISRKLFGEDVPPVNDIVYNTSLILVNNHYTLDQPHPLVPNYVEVAGIHIKKPKPLPADIQKFMDEAEYGVIYFSLGSLVRLSSLPNETIQAFKDTFAELPQKVLWKFEHELKDIPSNVMIGKWFPQNDIFQHPNMKLFISHGGNSGSIEAVHYGIPMVGIPLFFDQHRIIHNFVEKGVAVRLGINELTKNNILSCIKTVINDEGYAKRMKELSALFHNRPLKPLDTAVYWIEYVIRHKGAFHLRTAASTLSWYQYLLLDVIAFLLAIFIFVMLILKITFKYIYKSIKNIFSFEKIKTN